MKNLLATLAITLSLLPTAALAADLAVAPSDTVETVLAAQKGKRVTLKTRSGQEISGVVRVVTSRVVQIGQVAGKEFFDAVVALDAVEAVLVRTKD
jgi:hypothetical protein